MCFSTATHTTGVVQQSLTAFFSTSSVGEVTIVATKQLSPLWCWPMEHSGSGKFLPFFCVQTHLYAILMACWNLLSGRLINTNSLLPVGMCPVLHSPGSFFSITEWWARFTNSLGFIAFSKVLFIFRCTGGYESSLIS